MRLGATSTVPFRLYETIVEAMRATEKADLASFGVKERARVADEVGCTTSEVDDCIARFLWAKNTARCGAAVLPPLLQLPLRPSGGSWH